MPVGPPNQQLSSQLKSVNITKAHTQGVMINAANSAGNPIPSPKVHGNGGNGQ